MLELGLDADERQVRDLRPILEGRRQEAIAFLERELARSPIPPWADPPLGASWTTPGPEVGRQFEEAEGMLSERFA